MVGGVGADETQVKYISLSSSSFKAFCMDFINSYLQQWDQTVFQLH